VVVGSLPPCWAAIDEIRSSMLKPRSPQCYAGLNRTRLGHQRGVHAMTNLLEEAINSNDGDHAAKVVQEALGIESDDAKT